MNNPFDEHLAHAERVQDEAARAAAGFLIAGFLIELRRYNLSRHKLTIKSFAGTLSLIVNDSLWWDRWAYHGAKRFPVARLLKDIDDTLEKCDNAVARHLCGLTL